MQETISRDDFILAPYKEPLTKVESGFGYMGAISMTKEGKIQCHICGKTFDNLSFHLLSHKIKVKDYRKKFGLAHGTRLISEKTRQELKERMFKIRAMVDWKKWSKKGVEARKEYIKSEKFREDHKLSLEQKNLRGICPDQLISLIKDCVSHYNHVPSFQEFTAYIGTERFYRPIIKTFGSWSNAVKKSGFNPKTKSDNGKYRGMKPERRSDEELLEYLSDFYMENNSIPSKTDFARGLLPSYTVYLKRFGSIKNARLKANVPEYETT